MTSATEHDDPTTIGYADALAELEEILDELEDDNVDIDVLSARVERAAELIKVCRSRINDAHDKVAAIVADFDTITDRSDGESDSSPD